MSCEQLKLKNQLCFPVYAASRLIIREYQPYLDQLGITYPQYLVMMVLWENNDVSVSEITKRLILNTNTVTPLLQRLEKQGLLTRNRSKEDERKVTITLTEQGKKLEAAAADIPYKLSEGILESELSIDELLTLKSSLNKLIDVLNK